MDLSSNLLASCLSPTRLDCNSFLRGQDNWTPIELDLLPANIFEKFHEDINVASLKDFSSILKLFIRAIVLYSYYNCILVHSQSVILDP